MKSPIQKRVHLTKKVSLPSLTFQSEPHCRQCDIWLGGELAKEVAFTFMLLLLFLASPFCVVQWLAICLVCEVVSCFLKI